MHRREARIAAALPASVPAPRFLGSYDDGDWIALIFEDIDGTAPRTPWQQPELDRVLVAVGELSSALTPAPIAVEPVSELMPSVFSGWQRLAPSAESRHLVSSSSTGRGRAAALRGSTCSSCCQAWPCKDRPKPWEIFDVHPLGRSAPAAGVTAVVAAAAGFMIRGSRLPPTPGLPTVRAFQRDQGIRHWSGSSAAPAGPNPKGRRRSEDKAGGNAGSRPRRHRSLNPALQPT